MRGSRDDITEIGSQPVDAVVARPFQVVLGCLRLNSEPKYCLQFNMPLLPIAVKVFTVKNAVMQTGLQSG